MLADIILISILAITALGFLTLYIIDGFKCKHQWEYLHDTKYDNVGFRNKYPIVLVCTKCGKIKIVKGECL